MGDPDEEIRFRDSMVDLANTGEEPGSRGGQSICPTASPHVRRRKIVVGDTPLQRPPASTIPGEQEPDQVPQLTSRTPPGQTTSPSPHPPHHHPREPGGPSGDSPSFTSRSCCSSEINRALLFLEDVQNIAGMISPFSPGGREHPECTGRQNNHGRALRRDCLSLEAGRSHLHIFDCTRVFCYCFCFKV